MLRKSVIISLFVVASIALWGLRFSEVFGETGGVSEQLIVPRVFNLDAQNRSSINIQNVSTSSEVDVTVIYNDEDGKFIFLERETMPPRGTEVFDPPPDFLGSASIESNLPVVANARWNLGVSDQTFNVAVPIVSFNDKSDKFAVPIGSVPLGDKVGMAITSVSSGGPLLRIQLLETGFHGVRSSLGHRGAGSTCPTVVLEGLRTKQRFGSSIEASHRVFVGR